MTWSSPMNEAEYKAHLMTDAALIIEIRQIESSPTAHMVASIRRQRNEWLATLRREASDRGLEV